MWPWRRPPVRPAFDPDKIAQAITLAAYKISNRLEEIAQAIRATIPPEPPAPPVATQITLSYYRILGGPLMGVAITNAQVGQKYNPSVVESDATNPSIPPIGPLVYASDNPSVATVAADGTVSIVSTGNANVSVLDQGNGLTDTVAFAAAPPTPGPATAITLSYSPV